MISLFTFGAVAGRTILGIPMTFMPLISFSLLHCAMYPPFGLDLIPVEEKILSFPIYAPGPNADAFGEGGQL